MPQCSTSAINLLETLSWRSRLQDNSTLGVEKARDNLNAAISWDQMCLPFGGGQLLAMAMEAAAGEPVRLNLLAGWEVPKLECRNGIASRVAQRRRGALCMVVMALCHRVNFVNKGGSKGIQGSRSLVRSCRGTL